MRYLLPLLLVVMALSLSSCATIIDGTSSDVRITSEPSGATVLVDGIEKGKTPATVKMSKSDSNVVTLKLNGYDDSMMKVERKFAGWTVGNLVLGGLIGIIVDVVTGAVQRISPTEYHVNMTKR
ncbi:MAG: PEGA domain-containing protein [Planctomycetes bacterium]|nr:PEGA domain-containing protein [Planctomycetota bacterium]